MTIKLILLKSGEDVISDVSEMVVDDKVIGYFFDNPCVVNLITSDPQSSKFQLNMKPWMPLSKDKKVPVVSDWVITITEPIDQVKDMYEREVLNHGNGNNQDHSSSEQSDIGISD